jgi:RecJ-like exonuclease
MPECPKCGGKGFVVKKEPKVVWHSKEGKRVLSWKYQRVNCVFCEGKGIYTPWRIALHRSLASFDVKQSKEVLP